MKQIALIIIYNHQYNKNIDIIEDIYKNRFDHIFHLMPFYEGSRKNVIPVYENSYHFQGYIAQGLTHIEDNKFENYLFIADDLILNPIINQTNYKTYFQLTAKSCFIPWIIEFHKRIPWWSRTPQAFFQNMQPLGVESLKQLPSKEDAIKLFERHNLEFQSLKFHQIWRKPYSLKKWIKNWTNIKSKTKKDEILYTANYLLKYLTIRKNKKILPYPMVGSYSDICLVHESAIKKFRHYCGVFAAINLFVEIGLPTALVLSADKIIDENQLKLAGKALWPDGFYRLTNDKNPVKKDFQELKKFDYSLHKLLNDFPENYLYLHPIKLSKWK